MFNSFILLSPDVLVLPMTSSHGLGICQINSEHPSPSADDASVPSIEPTCILGLPPIVPRAQIVRLSCRCEPNPRASVAVGAHMRAPFTSDPATALLILHMALGLPNGTSRMYTMLTHRSTLLRLFHDALVFQTSPLSSSASTLPWTRRLDSDNDGEYLADDAYGNDEAEEDGDRPAALAWDAWGPRGTRWFQEDFEHTHWITTACGQRLVRAYGDGVLRVYDFNARALRRYLDAREAAGEPVGTRVGESVVHEGVRIMGQGMSGQRTRAHATWVEADDDLEDEDGTEWAAGAIDGEVEAEVVVAGPAQPTIDSATETQCEKTVAEDPRRTMRVVLGTTVISGMTGFRQAVETSLPYVETVVHTSMKYDSALVDEDIIVGLEVCPSTGLQRIYIDSGMQMDRHHHQIQAVVLNRVGASMCD